MSSTLQTTEQRAQKWGTVAKIASIGIIGFFVSPFVLSAITGVLGLATLAIIYGITWVTLPAIGDFGKNMRLKMIKEVAARDPIGTLQNEHSRQSSLLEDRKEAIETMSGAIRTLAETISKLEREFPDSPELAQMKQDYSDLRIIEQSRMEGWQQAYLTLGEFAKEIKRASRIWEVAVAMAKARGASGLSDEEWNAKMKAETSFDAIRTKLNTEMSALNTEKMQADAERILRSKTTINVTPAAAPAALPAPSRGIPVEVLSPASSKTRAV